MLDSSTDAEQLALTEQLFDAAFGELSVVARGQPCLLVGDFNVEPTKIPVWQQGFRLGSRALGPRLLACNRNLLVSVVGVLLVVVVGILRLGVPLLLLLLLFFLAGFNQISG